MYDERSSGRTLGILLLLQMAAALVLPFVLLRPVSVGSSAFPAAAVENAGQIRTAVLISYFGAVLTIAIGVTVWPILRRMGERFAVAFIAACMISATLDAVHNASVMAMLSFAKQNVGTNVSPELAGVVYAGRVSAHYAQLFAIGAWMFIFYVSMWRFRLIPRILAGLGLIAIPLQFSGVTLSHYIGYPMQGGLAMPLAPVHVAVGIWLIIKGLPSVGSQDPASESKA